MTPTQVLNFFRTLIDDTPDADEEEVLMETAYAIRNDARFWTFLLKLDSSITHSTSDTWESTKTLPTDFSEAFKVFGGDSDNEYDPFPFEEILRWKGSSNRYTIDFANEKMRFPAPAGSAKTIYLWYKYVPTSLIGLSDAQKAAATTIVWPKRFCPILAYDMAAIHMGGVDADDTTRQQVPYLNATHKRLADAMLSWDNRRRMQMFGHSATPRRTGASDHPDVINMGN